MPVYTVSLTDGTTLANLAVAAGRGPKGDGFTGGSFNASTGIVTFTSNDGLGFATGDLRSNLSEPSPIGDVTPNTGAFTSLSTTGNTIIGGNLTVNGTTTTVNSQTLDVVDKNITIAFGSVDAAAANGAGLTVDGAGATLTYVAAGDKWSLNKPLDVTGNIALTGTVDGRDVSADGSKLDGIEALADVTDTANVTAAGALMDSEVTNLAAVKAFDPTDYATSAQGSLADTALQDGDTVASLAITSADINGGSIDGTAINTSTIDGTVIGGSTPAAISATTGQFGTSLNVDGTVTADGLVVAGTTDGTEELARFGNNAGTQELIIEQAGSTGYAIKSSVDLRLYADYDNDTSDAGSNIEMYTDGTQRMSITGSTGDISFYEDTGTTPKLFWDASAERLGLGTVSPSGSLQISTGSSGTTASVGYNELVIEGGNEDIGMVFISPAANNRTQTIAFGDSNNNGSGKVRYDHASDAMIFNTANAERARITSTGNVGIADAAPVAKLSVRKTGGSTDPNLELVSGGPGDPSTTDPYLTFSASGLETRNTVKITSTGAFNQRALTFHTGPDTAGTERMRITSTGSVGIGTSSPSSFNAAADNLVVGTTSGNNGITIATGTANQGSLFFADGTASGAEQAAGYLFYEHSSNFMAFGTVNTERARIDASGNVGIGTSNPVAKFHVVGDTIRFNDPSGNYFTGFSFDTTVPTGGSIISQLNSSGYLQLEAGSSTSSNSTIRFKTANTERARIDSSGNLLVGTTSSTVRVDSGGTNAIPKVISAAASTGTTRTSEPPLLTLLNSSGTLTANRMARLSFAAVSNNLGLPIHSADITAVFSSGASGNGVSSNLVFSTCDNAATQAPAERLRIDSSGNLLVATTARRTNEKVVFVFNGTTGSGLNLDDSSSVGTSQAQLFHRNGGLVGTITTTLSTTSYNITSDYRLKEDVQPMVGASDRVLSLKPVNFAWKVDGTRVDGFIAHEAQAVVPEAVTGEKDGDEMQVMDQSKLVPLLTAALQEALKEIADLKGRITALEA